MPTLLTQLSSGINIHPMENHAEEATRNDEPAENAARTGVAHHYAGFETLGKVRDFPQYLPPKYSEEFILKDEEKATCQCHYIAEDIPQRIHNSINRLRNFNVPKEYKMTKTHIPNEYFLIDKKHIEKKAKRGEHIRTKAPYGYYTPGWKFIGLAASIKKPVDKYASLFEETVGQQEEDAMRPHNNRTIWKVLKDLASGHSTTVN